jgi:hypothetical protein
MIPPMENPFELAKKKIESSFRKRPPLWSLRVA